MKETQTRSLVRSLIWRAIALSITYKGAWISIGSIESSILIALVANFLKTILNYALERVFQSIEWGHLK